LKALGLVFGAALLFYVATLAPTLVWGDSAWLTLYALRGPITFGTAGDHPFYLIVGRLFLLLPGDPARNLALESAVFGAVGAALAYRCGRQLGARPPAAALGAAALTVSHSFWQHAVIPEVYTVNAAFLLGIITVLLDWRRDGGTWRLAGMAVIFLVGLTNHMVLAAVLPAVLAFAMATRPQVVLSRPVVISTAALLVLAAAALVVGPAPIREAAYRVWVGPPGISEYFRLSVDVPTMAREAGFYVLYLGYQFPSAALPLALAGAVALIRTDRSAAWLLLLAIGVNAVTFIHHTAWPSQASAKFVFYISDYAVWAVLCGIGVEALLRWLASHGHEGRTPVLVVAMIALTIASTPVLYAVMPGLVSRAGIDLVRARYLPYRDNARFFLNPNKRGETSARMFAHEALAVVPPDAVIFADYTPFSVLRYAQLVHRLRPDVTLRYRGAEGDRVRIEWVMNGETPRPIFVASLTREYYDYSAIEGQYELVSAGPIFEVRRRAHQ